MDWLALQHRLRLLWYEYYESRNLSRARILSARSNDTGGAGDRVDVAVRELAYGKLLRHLSEEEKDILAVRLNWACLVAGRESMRPIEREDTPEPGDLEFVLIRLWNEKGRNQWDYWMHSAQTIEDMQHLARFQSPSNQPPMA